MAICVPELRKSRMIQVSTGVQTAKRQTALASCLVSVTTRHLLCQGFGFFGMETCWEWIELSKIMNMILGGPSCGEFCRISNWCGPFRYPQLDCCEEPARHPTVASRDWSSSRLKLRVTLKNGYPPKKMVVSNHFPSRMGDLSMKTDVDIGLGLVHCHVPI